MKKHGAPVVTPVISCLFILGLTLSRSPLMADTKPVLVLKPEALPTNLHENHVKVTPVRHDGRPALQIDFHVSDWPNAFFSAPPGGWEWSDHAGLAVDVYNPGNVTTAVCLRVDNAGADGRQHCNTGAGMVGPKETATIRCRFTRKENNRFWGMRGVPILGAVTSGPPLDPAQIVAFQVFLPRPGEPRRLVLTRAYLFGEGGDLAKKVPFPFVDRFGQYKHADWPGKVHSQAELRQRGQAEAAEWEVEPQLPKRDSYGGWSEGPRLEATGWFRTERIGGKWWLVTPDGHLFFSLGIDCVGTWQRTFITGRDGWFEWLPGPADSLFKQAFTRVSGAHSMAERIGGKGLTFGFYVANLIRKYGARWEGRWRDTAYRRLRYWGFNTIANWSQADVLQHSPLPFVVSLGSGSGVEEIQGARGYWGRMKDVFSDTFAPAVDRSIARGVKPYADNPLCLGYFVDNEISWETVRKGTLASRPDQPCRKVLVRRLQAKYGGLAKLNEAWGTNAGDWASLRAPENESTACRSDLDAFEYDFAHRYFAVIDHAVKKHAPHQLYLGCRFSSAPRQAVRACADVVDVVSFNRYERKIDCSRYTGDNDLGKPMIIGEFHFGALDRGMFHPGLVPCRNQAERARSYQEYVRAVVDCPALVGCHWFQFVDEPLTGRWFDGENYNIGFLTVTDTPYPELVEAAREVHREVYRRRYGKP